MCIRDRLREISSKLENENNQIKIKISELSDENQHIDILKNENKQMAEEIAAYEEPVSYTHLDVYKRQVCESQNRSS